MRTIHRIATILIAIGVAGASASAHSQDRHAGYYYPEPATTEVYEARAGTLP